MLPSTQRVCCAWSGREAPDEIGEELQVVTWEAELEGLKDEGSEGESDEGEEDNPFDPTVNLNFEVDEEGNVVWPTATDTSLSLIHISEPTRPY